MPEKKTFLAAVDYCLIRLKRKYDGIGQHPATIRKYVNANIACMSLLKPGAKGEVPACAFKSLCVAFESYVHIQQINSQQGKLTDKKLAVRINHVLKHNYKQKMLQCILLATTKNLDASTIEIVEDQGLCGTMFANILSWFIN